MRSSVIPSALGRCPHPTPHLPTHKVVTFHRFIPTQEWVLRVVGGVEWTRGEMTTMPLQCRNDNVDSGGGDREGAPAPPVSGQSTALDQPREWSVRVRRPFTPAPR